MPKTELYTTDEARGTVEAYVRGLLLRVEELKTQNLLQKLQQNYLIFFFLCLTALV